MIERKKCQICDIEKAASEFYHHPSRKDRLDHRCKACRTENERIIRDLKKTAPPKPLVCECCKKQTTKFCLDHDHTTDEFRGWICGHCNQGIGKLGDTLEGVLLAVDYLSTKVQPA